MDAVKAAVEGELHPVAKSAATVGSAGLPGFPASV
jgi:hypothetical protein